jgi:hypothetical protein
MIFDVMFTLPRGAIELTFRGEVRRAARGFDRQHPGHRAALLQQ